MKASTGIMIAIGLGALLLYANSETNTPTPPVTDPMPPVQDPVEFEPVEGLVVQPVEADFRPGDLADFDFYFPVVQGPRVAGGL